MSGNYSYIDIARTDLAAAHELLKAHMYNHAVRLCQQYIEKLMKECIHQISNFSTKQNLLCLQ